MVRIIWHYLSICSIWILVSLKCIQQIVFPIKFLFHRIGHPALNERIMFEIFARNSLFQIINILLQMHSNSKWKNFLQNHSEKPMIRILHQFLLYVCLVSSIVPFNLSDCQWVWEPYREFKILQRHNDD